MADERPMAKNTSQNLKSRGALDSCVDNTGSSCVVSSFTTLGSWVGGVMAVFESASVVIVRSSSLASKSTHRRREREGGKRRARVFVHCYVQVQHF
jgi:hypothetical protein